VGHRNARQLRRCRYRPRIWLAVGTESIDEDGNLAAFEIGWIFNRSLEFRALPGSHDIGETLMLQWVTRRR